MSTGPATCPTYPPGSRPLRAGYMANAGAWYTEVRATGRTAFGTTTTRAILAACFACVPFFPRADHVGRS